MNGRQVQHRGGRKMTVSPDGRLVASHSHVFLGADHARSERQTWAVIVLCTVMMIAEIVGGHMFGSIALVADGWHMSTHAGALLLAAMAYTLARRRANDPRYSFGTGKFGDLAGFSSAIVLGMIALLIGFESLSRLFSPGPIAFAQAIPIAGLGLIVNVASAWLLSMGGHAHAHSHSHEHKDHSHETETHRIETNEGILELEIFETGVVPRFRLRAVKGILPAAALVSIETLRPDGASQQFAMKNSGVYLESLEAIPEPHEFMLNVRVGSYSTKIAIKEHSHATHTQEAKMHRDNNMRAAIVHVIADAAVSVMVIAGLLAAKTFGWLWMDPLAGLVGAVVIASWAVSLVRDTGAILLDMCPDKVLEKQIRAMVQAEGDEIADLHTWRLGPGHLGAIISILARTSRTPDDYRFIFRHLPSISHLTIEVNPQGDRRDHRAAA
jgi:cation diffusion facilitator family transporter